VDRRPETKGSARPARFRFGIGRPGEKAATAIDFLVVDMLPTTAPRTAAGRRLPSGG
jgi:hypothetical protein